MNSYTQLTNSEHNKFLKSEGSHISSEVSGTIKRQSRYGLTADWFPWSMVAFRSVYLVEVLSFFADASLSFGVFDALDFLTIVLNALLLGILVMPFPDSCTVGSISFLESLIVLFVMKHTVWICMATSFTPSSRAWKKFLLSLFWVLLASFRLYLSFGAWNPSEGPVIDAGAGKWVKSDPSVTSTNADSLVLSIDFYVVIFSSSELKKYVLMSAIFSSLSICPDFLT